KARASCLLCSRRKVLLYISLDTGVLQRPESEAMLQLNEHQNVRLNSAGGCVRWAAKLAAELNESDELSPWNSGAARVAFGFASHPLTARNPIQSERQVKSQLSI